jgi:hypothetical protein
MTARADSWKREPFTQGEPIAYAREFTAAEFARLREGLLPYAMEDKWFIYFETPYLYFHRSWTGTPVYRVALTPKDDGAEASEALWVPTAQRNPDPAYASKLLDFLIAYSMLGEARSFPLPPGIEDGKSALLVRHSTGGYRQGTPPSRPARSMPPKRRWWKFWR